MVGREAYHNPCVLSRVDARFFADPGEVADRALIVERMLPYIERELSAGSELKHIARHMLGLFQGVPGARAWRRHLSEHAPQAGAGPEVILDALAAAGAVGEEEGTARAERICA
jgi:tRNA-dihydrouridine synthase A